MVLGIGMLLASWFVHASDDGPAPTGVDAIEAGYDARAVEPVDADIVRSEGFLLAHPDQRFRILGMQARRSGHHGQARMYFQRAARFGDKLSQGAIGEMYWRGEGGERDRALAYAWMDLAAERGARLLLAHRERYWSALEPDERTRAVREGAALYAEFGDAVAKPRLEKLLRSGRRNVTGSRAGWVGPLSICIAPTQGKCTATVTGEQYYANRYWMPAQYWAWQDRLILTPEPGGDVQVGPVDVVRPDED